MREVLCVFVRNTLAVKDDDKIQIVSYALKPTETPKAIDVIAGNTKSLGIYRLEGDTLTLCANEKERPKEFASEEGSKTELWVFKRPDKAQAKDLDHAFSRIALKAAAFELETVTAELQKESLDPESELKALERLESVLSQRKKDLLKKREK